MKRAHSTRVFGIWAVYYPDGKPEVYPPLREAFDRQKPEKSWTDQQMFDQEVLGRSMFYHKVHGACTSSSVYLATIFRALGIPTRIVFCVPPFAPNDDVQAQMFYNRIHHHQALSQGLRGDSVLGQRGHLAQDRTRLAPGVAYGIRPLNVSDTYRWVVAPGTLLTVAHDLGDDRN